NGKIIQHKGKRGTYVTMVDGTVRFIDQNVADDVFKAMCTVSGPAPQNFDLQKDPNTPLVPDPVKAPVKTEPVKEDKTGVPTKTEPVKKIVISSKDTHKGLMTEYVDLTVKMSDVLSTVKDRQSAEKAAPKIA